MFSTLIKLRCSKLQSGILALLLLLALHTQAQVKQSNRFEVALAANEPAYNITPTQDNGLFLQRYLTGTEMDQIDLVKLDTAFTEQWRGYLPIERNHYIVGKRGYNGKLYLLLRQPVSNDFSLYVLNENDGRYSKFFIKSFIRFNTTELQVTDESILIGGYFNRVPLVLHYSLKTEQSKVLPGIFNEEGELTQIKTYTDGTFHVLINARNMYKQKTVWIKNYTADGLLVSNFALAPESNKSLLFGRSLKTANGMQIVSGVYANRHSDYSRGIYVATIDPNGHQQIKYYNYGDLDNFFKYMKAKREYRVKERIERRKIKGKKIRFNYRVIIHELIEDGDQYILLGEAFYPQYTSISQSSYGNRGFFQPYSSNTPYLRGDQVFDGYRYTHAVIIGFDRNGRKLWDNSFEINDVKTYTLEQYVKLDTDHDKIALLYLYNNQIRSKIIKGDQVLEGKTEDPIKTLYDTDVLLAEDRNVNQLNYWYNDFFYAYGVQNIVNTGNQTIPKRRVFYLNKISYR